MTHATWKPDLLQDLLEQAYQKDQRRPVIHLHRCAVCEGELTCVCGDRRGIDRATGKRKEFLCLFCQKLRDELAGLPTAEDLDAVAEEERIRRATEHEEVT